MGHKSDDVIYVLDETYTDQVDDAIAEYYEYQYNNVYDEGNVEIECEVESDSRWIVCGEDNETGMGSRIIQEYYMIINITPVISISYIRYDSSDSPH